MSVNIHPVTSVVAPILAPHHADGIMSAVDTGTEAPNRDNPPHPLVESHIPNAENGIGKLTSEFGLSQSVKAVVQSLPFKSSQDMEQLLFSKSSTNDLNPQQGMMLDAIFDENMRQEMNTQIRPTVTSDMTLDQALDGEDGFTPADADPSMTGSWKSLRAR